MFFHCKRVSLQIKALRPEASQLSVVVFCCGAVPGADLPPHWRTTVFCLRFGLLHTVQHKEKQTLQVTWKFWDPRMKCTPIEYSWQYSNSELFPVSLGVTEAEGNTVTEFNQSSNRFRLLVLCKTLVGESQRFLRGIRTGAVLLKKSLLCLVTFWAVAVSPL